MPPMQYSMMRHIDGGRTEMPITVRVASITMPGMARVALITMPGSQGSADHEGDATR